MQKLLNYPHKKTLNISITSSGNNDALPVPDTQTNKYEKALQPINNYLKKPEEIEAEFSLLINTENQDNFSPAPARKKAEEFATHSTEAGLLVFPDFMEENY